MDGSAAPTTILAPHARGTYRHPYPGLVGRLALFARLPFPVLRGDVADVVYVTWMVDARAAAALLPPGQRLLGRLVLSHIDLPIPLDAVRPLVPAGPVACSLLDALSAAGEPLCFLVPQVPFRVLSETVLADRRYGGLGEPTLRYRQPTCAKAKP